MARPAGSGAFRSSISAPSLGPDSEQIVQRCSRVSGRCRTQKQTRGYLLDAQRLLAAKPSPREFFDRMLRLYPDRLNVSPVWYSALALLS
jgi:hypothetical protein